MKKTLLVSACLLGTPSRYDGKSKGDGRVIALLDKYDLIPVCPETLGGLPTPRQPSERVGERVINRAGEDVTDNYMRGALAVLELARLYKCEGAILKAKSPACGKGKIYDGSFSRTLGDGDGVCAELLMKNGIRVYTEEELFKLDEL